MPIEVEVKAWVVDRPAVEAALSNKAVFEREFVSRDIYFIQSHSEEPHLRLRREDAIYSVTTKDKSIANGIEVNDEIEFEVSDGLAFCRLLNRFGFEPHAVKHKRGQTFRAGQVRIDLVEVEGLGLFIEVEILCEEVSHVKNARREVMGWLARLDINPDAIEATPYTQLLRERYRVRYEMDLDNADTLVREITDEHAGRQEHLP